MTESPYHIKVSYLKETGSTNAKAMDLLANGSLEPPFVVRAGFQSSGKGMGGNTWQSEPGKNLLFTLCIHPKNLHPENIFLVSKTVSLALAVFLRQYVKADISIKWPNDLLVNEKKIAGMLIQNELGTSGVYHSFIGLGININQTVFPGNILGPTSLKSIAQKDFDLDNLFANLLQEIMEWWVLLEQQAYSYINNRYLENLYLFGKDHVFKDEQGNSLRGRISGISHEGLLEVMTENGKKAFPFKGITF